MANDLIADETSIRESDPFSGTKNGEPKDNFKQIYKGWNWIVKVAVGRGIAPKLRVKSN